MVSDLASPHRVWLLLELLSFHAQVGSCLTISVFDRLSLYVIRTCYRALDSNLARVFGKIKASWAARHQLHKLLLFPRWCLHSFHLTPQLYQLEHGTRLQPSYTMADEQSATSKDALLPPEHTRPFRILDLPSELISDISRL